MHYCYNMAKILAIDTPQLTHQGKVWEVFCDLKLWFTYCFSHCSVIGNIKLCQTKL